MVEFLPKSYAILRCRIAVVYGTYPEKNKSTDAVNPGGSIFNWGIAFLKQKVSRRNCNQSRYKVREEINGFP